MFIFLLQHIRYKHGIYFIIMKYDQKNQNQGGYVGELKHLISPNLECLLIVW